MLPSGMREDSGYKRLMPRREWWAAVLTFPVTSALHDAPALRQLCSAICLSILSTMHLLARAQPMHGVLAWKSERPGVSWLAFWFSGCHFIFPMLPDIFLKPMRAKNNTFAFLQSFPTLALNLYIKLKKFSRICWEILEFSLLLYMGPPSPTECRRSSSSLWGHAPLPS